MAKTKPKFTKEELVTLIAALDRAEQGLSKPRNEVWALKNKILVMLIEMDGSK